jgi:uncharacterized RDD family membrane protein YckC
MTALNTISDLASPETSTEVRYAGFWTRLGAYIIDYIFTFVISLVGGFIIGFLYAILMISIGLKPDQGTARLMGAAEGVIVQIAYYVFFVSGPWQATPGKRLLGIHIIRTNGEAMTSILAFGRLLAYVLSSLTLLIGFMMIGWTEEKKGLHDIICRTRVIYGKL